MWRALIGKGDFVAAGGLAFGLAFQQHADAAHQPCDIGLLTGHHSRKILVLAHQMGQRFLEPLDPGLVRLVHAVSIR